LLPEFPPNYPHPQTWDTVDGIEPKKIIKLWEKSISLNKNKRPVIYVHIPFCQYICKFCGFYKKIPQDGEIDLYLNFLEKEVKLFDGIFKNYPIRWLCFGGGTPSMLSERQLIKLFDIFRQNFKIDTQTKIALETNPNSLTLQKAKLLKELGVNFLAIGIQNLDENLMKKYGRVQTTKECINAIKNAKKVRIDNIEADFLLGLPGEDREKLKQDILEIAKLDIERIYLFDYQPRFNTNINNFKSASLSYTTLEEIRNLRMNIIDSLVKLGYKMHCGHWVYKRKGCAWPYSYDQQEDERYSIIGLGPTSISYANNALRSQNISNLNKYINYLKENKLPIEKFKKLTKEDESINFIITSLIHRGEFSLKDYYNIFNDKFLVKFKEEFKILESEKILFKSGNKIIINNRGKATSKLRFIFYKNLDFIKLAKKYKIKVKKIKNNLQKRSFDKKIDDSKILVLGNNEKINDIFKEVIYKKNNNQDELIILPYNYNEVNENYIKNIFKILIFTKNLNFKKIYIYIPKTLLRSNKIIQILYKVNNLSKNIMILIENLNYFSKDYNNFYPAFLVIKQNMNIVNELEKIDKKTFLIFPSYSRQIISKKEMLSYSQIMPKILDIMKNNKKIFLINFLPCMVRKNYNKIILTSNTNLGDSREKSSNITKLEECLNCQFLLKCQGPDNKYLQFFKDKEIKAIV
jgi:oxygen-independent coproporphyrinogen-3 oxidase